MRGGEQSTTHICVSGILLYVTSTEQQHVQWQGIYGSVINIEKTKAMVQSWRPGRRGTLTFEDHDIEVVARFKYLGMVLNDTNEEKEVIQARILAANKAYSSLQSISRSKQIHRNNKIRLYKSLIKPILSYGSVTWTLTQTTEQMLNTFERKIRGLFKKSTNVCYKNFIAHFTTF